MRELLRSILPDVDRRLRAIRNVCRLETCRKSQLRGKLQGSRQGIHVGADWYCSAECFAEAACAPLKRLADRRVIEIPRHPRLSLGLFLVSRGYLTTEQFRVAEAKCQGLGEDIEETLVKLGLATQKALASARSAQWGYPVLAQEFLGKAVEASVPMAFLRAHGAVPLHYSATAKRILLGFSGQIEHIVLEAIEEITRCRVEPCFITPAVFERQSERVTSAHDYEEMIVDVLSSSESTTRKVSLTAVQVAAEEAWFSQCKDCLLVRVAGKLGIRDVIIHVPSGPEVRFNEISRNFSDAIAV